jgi:hypothetical protein
MTKSKMEKVKFNRTYKYVYNTKREYKDLKEAVLDDFNKYLR